MNARDSHLAANANRKRPMLPRIERKVRQRPVLHPSPLPDHAGVLSVNLTAGCVHGCPFCSARALPSFPGESVVFLYANTCAKLEEELAARRQRPQAVYLCPATDPFPPIAEIQAETARVVELLARHGVETWLLTRGFIRPSALQVLAKNREFVKVTFGMTTLDRALQRTLEPLTAPPRLRLRQISQLKSLGIPVRVDLQPLIPGLTDTRGNQEPLLDALSERGITRVTAGYLYLREGLRQHLAGALEPLGLAEPVLEAFRGGPVLRTEGQAPAQYLPKSRRQRGYAALMALAAGRGISVCVNALTNSDFRTPIPREPQQRLFPAFQSLSLSAT